MAKSNSVVRIIGGRLRGKQIPVLDQPSLRPTGSRVRETLFNWLQSEIPDANVIDLFAGSGALGFESFSRGARSVILNELNSASAKHLQQIATSLNSPAVTVSATDWRDCIKLATDPIHIVFIDPPFQMQPIDDLLETLETSSKLAEDAAIYIEQPKQVSINVPSNWQIRRHKTAGDVQYLLCDRT